MGRCTLNKQVKQLLYSKQAFGESRHLAKAELKERLGDKYRFGMSDNKIHSVVTFNTYLSACDKFATWLQEIKGIKKYTKINDCKDYAREYIKYRIDNDGVSVWTAKMERSALSKLYSEQIKVELPKRSTKEITRSRGERVRDRHFSEKKNKDLVTFAVATGCRRSDLEKLKPRDFRIDENGNMWIDVKGSKGGRDRSSPILPHYQEYITNFIKDKEQDKPIFYRIKQGADIHHYRDVYAQELYQYIQNDRTYQKQLLDKYPPRKEYKSVKDKNGNRITKEIKGQFFITRNGNPQKFLRDDVYIVSQALGHNRLDVTVTHYLTAK